MLRVVWKGEHPIPDNETRERLNKMRKAEVLTDLVLMSDGKAFPCHRILLTNASRMVRDVIQMNPSMLKVPTILVDDSHVRSMEKLLNCVYLGFQQVESNTLESIALLANQLQVAIRLEGCSIPKKNVQVETFSKSDKPKSIKKSKEGVRRNAAKPRNDDFVPKESIPQPGPGKNDDGGSSKQITQPAVPQVGQPPLVNVVNAGTDVVPQQKSLPVKKAKKTKSTCKSASEPKTKKPRVAVAAIAQEKDVPSDEVDGELRPQVAISEKALLALKEKKVDKKSKERKPKSTEGRRKNAGKPAKVSRKKAKLPVSCSEVGTVEQLNVLPVVQTEAQPIVPMREIQPENTKDSFSRQTALVARRKRKMSFEIQDVGVSANRGNDRAYLDERTGRFSAQVPNLHIPNTVSHSKDFEDFIIPEDPERPRRAAFMKAMQNFRVSAR